MQVAQAPALAVQITGPRDAIERALLQGLLPDAHYHEAHGITWIELADISEHAEVEMTGAGCRVHRR
jgi:hypothetical protein